MHFRINTLKQRSYLMLIAIIWLAFCAGAATLAETQRGRNGAAWFFIAFFGSPLLAFVFLLCLPSLKPAPQVLRPVMPPPLPQPTKIIVLDQQGNVLNTIIQ